MVILKKIIVLSIIIIFILIISIFSLSEKENINYNIDNDKPIINLIGDKTIKLKLGQNFIEPGYRAYDKNGIDITKNVSVVNNLNINKSGNYKLTYKVSDKDGNTTITSRYIDILSEVDMNKKTIYLTFDDILNILKEENVKATFFVINHDSKYDYLIKREFEDGHTVGLHSYTHKYNTIYKSIDSYIYDLNKIKNKVENIIHTDVNIIRFPGGSSNTISNINMRKLTKEITNDGYYYYDWNISSFDTSHISSKRIYNKIVSQLNRFNYTTNIILMHDFQNNKKTVKALRNIIKYGKENNYNFSNITIHHSLDT